VPRVLCVYGQFQNYNKKRVNSKQDYENTNIKKQLTMREKTCWGTKIKCNAWVTWVLRLKN